MAKILSWGKCRVLYRTSGSSSAWSELDTPAEGTTTLATTKGDKTEAKIEGGENEAVRFMHNTYQLSATIRMGSTTKKPFNDADGVINDQYSVLVIPENANAVGLYIENSQVSLEDSYSSADGVQLAYAFDALTATSGNQIKWGKVELTESTAGDITSCTKIKFTEVQYEGGASPSAVTLYGSGS